MRKFMFLIAVITSLTAAAQTGVLHPGLSLPPDLSEEVIEWQRDIYRVVDVRDSENQGLFSPQEENIFQQGLFMRLLQLATAGTIPVYRYVIDGTEQFNEESREDIAHVLYSHHIPYVPKDGRVYVRREDIPLSEVTRYYIRESVFYDLTNSSFRTLVTAICPVMTENGDFGEEDIQYPLFWVKYSEAEPYLRDLPVIADYRNTAEVMPVTEYFTLNRYKGDIIKVADVMGRSLAQTQESDSALQVRQAAIERELIEVRQNTYSVFRKPVPRKKKNLLKAITGLFHKDKSQKKEKVNDQAVTDKRPAAYRKRYDAQ